MTRVRLRRRSGTPQEASQSPTVAPGESKRARALDRLVAAESARIVPSESSLDGLSEVTPEDIDAAVEMWDTAQKEERTGLDGLLDARADDD